MLVDGRESTRTIVTDPAAAPQAFTALALTHLRDWTSVGWTRVAWIVGVMVVTALFLAVPRRVGWILPAVVLLLLSGATAVASADVKRLSSELRRNLFGALCDTATPLCMAHLPSPCIGRLVRWREAFDFVAMRA